MPRPIVAVALPPDEERIVSDELAAHGFRRRPRSTAFFASSPAPTMTAGLDVFVHDVIAAITTTP
jgi:hypothetical protein